MAIVIGFEGLDGSGKSTQIEILKNTLQSWGKDVEVIREPTQDIASLLSTNDYTPEQMLLLFTVSRIEVKAKINSMRSDDTIILCDRTFLSSYAYQVSGMGISSKFYNDMLNLARINYDKIFVLKSKRIKLEDKMDSVSYNIRKRIEDGYNYIVQSVINAQSIDTDEFNIVDTSKIILTAVEKLIGMRDAV